jgi:hypothetical protein
MMPSRNWSQAKQPVSFGDSRADLSDRTEVRQSRLKLVHQRPRRSGEPVLCDQAQ